MTFYRLFLCPAAALAVLSLWISHLDAQNLKPVAVVSIASVEKNLADIVYLTRIVGMEDTGKTAQLFGNALTAGMDKSRPSGLVVIPSGQDFHAVAFVPVTDLKLLLEVHKEQVGVPKDIGGSILEIGTDQKAYVKEQVGWAFIAEQQEHLAVLPADPAQLLADLPAKYNVAVRLMAQNIPTELKQLAIDQMKAGIKQAAQGPAIPGAVPGRGPQPIPGQPNPPAPAPDPQQAQMLEASMQQIERLINDAEDVTIGLAVNPEGKSVSLDLAVTAREGTELAKTMAMQTGIKSSFSGFPLPEASLSFRATAAVSDADAALAKKNFDAQREQMKSAMEILSKNATPEAADTVKKLTDQVFDLMAESAASKFTDQAMVLVLGPGSLNAAVGSYIPDGAKLEQVLTEAAKSLNGQKAEDGSTIELVLNVGNHGDVKLHRGAMPASNAVPINKQLFGEKMSFIIGTGKNSGYLAVGKDGETLLKKVIDRSAAQASQPVQPFQMTVSVVPILKFAQSLQPNPLLAGLTASLEQEGGDKLLVTGTAGPRSIAYRIEVQEGIIRAGGQIGQMFAPQFGAGLPQ
ncbi:MAG TPA: hypothetical protein VFV87_05535 [Pirellulaceae bacterium]|nr:hypothetical protein [Pirellulaceae bacterium]